MTEQTGNNKPNEAEGLAFPLSGNEKLIEEAAAQRYPHRNVFLEGMAYMSEERSRIPLREAFVEGAKWQAEKAHTPTDDEREALRIAHLDARQAAYRKEREDWFVDHEAEPEIASNAFFRGWDAAVGGGFRRSEVPEPSAECPQPCVHLSQHDAREGRTCAEHPCTCPEPQGEPSDAEAWAAAHAFAAALKEQTGRPQMVNVEHARAALRAAGVVGQEGEKR